MISKTWLTAIIMLAVNILPHLGVLDVNAEDLTTTVATIVNIVGPLFIWFRGWYMGRHTIAGRALPTR
jgi:hypothetical protein